ncbi:MAG: hypothetical protein KAS63_00450 [Candidatus Heimdallarchaeota archaeon]|nr:hypothetical protein [Candidatus Heimdallarchaeota archaeon]MCK4953813.1 hypothetical protein [Candidatus Heimdallarchaeota archaeon]
MIENKPTFRKINDEEKEIVSFSIMNSFYDEAFGILRNYAFWIKDGKIREVFVVPITSDKILEKLPKTAYFAGIPFGSLWKSDFQLEIEGSKLLAPFSKKVIHVTTDQFLYGKPIFVENIGEITDEFRKGDTLIVFGRSNLHYGIGQAEIDSTEISAAKSNTVIIKGHKKRPLDRGWYLREGD